MKPTTISIFEETKKEIDLVYTKLIEKQYNKKTAEMIIKGSTYEDKMKIILNFCRRGNV